MSRWIDDPGVERSGVGGTEALEAVRSRKGIIKEHEVSLYSHISRIGWWRISEVGVEIFIRGGWLNDGFISGRAVVSREV